VTVDLTKHDQPEAGPPPGGPALAAAAGIIPVAVGLLTLWSARGLGLGSPTNPGPGLWPSAVAVLLLGTGTLLCWGARRASDTEAFTRGTLGVVIGTASLAVYAYLFEVIGFEIPTALVLALWLRVLGGEGWLTTAVISVASTAAAYALFITGLGVPLPHLIGS
jgi:putative tricarboxylic transport membrane protein